MVQTVDFRGVPLCRAGEWNGLTGKARVTSEDLRSVVDAYTDQEVDRARVKIGHLSGMNTALGDGAPAFGWVQNPRMDPDGVTLVGDLVDVPRKLGEIVGKAYKNVSIEMRRNVKTPSGKTHPAVLSGLALLGASAPAVKGLDDLVSLYASEAPNGGPEDDCTETETVTISLGAAFDTDPTVPDVSPVRGDDDTDSPESPGRNQQEDADMAFLSEARKALGLGEDVAEADVLAKLTALSETPAPEGNEVAAVEQAPEPANEPEPEAKSPETVTVSKAQWEDVTAQLKTLSDKAKIEHQEKVLETALSEGRIVPAEREQWVTALSEAPQATEVLLSKLAPRVNMTEAGADVALSAGDQTEEDNVNRALATRSAFGL